jgi:hypothetical protein
MTKRFALVLLSVLLGLGTLTACGSPTAGPQRTPVVGVQNTPGQGAAGPESGSENTGNQPPSGGAVALQPTTTTSAADNPQTAGTAASTQAAGSATGAALSGTGGNSAGMPQGKTDPCTLVTNADIAEIVGESVNAGTRVADQTGAITCQYTGTSGNTTSIGITIYDEPAQVNAVRQRLAQAQNTQTVSGLGNEAVIADNNLFVRIGNVYLSVIVVTQGQPARAGEAARTLAERAILRLPVTF